MATDMLSSLPVELLTIVVAHLEWEDYAACRLTCRRIEAVLFSSFARDSFTTCRVMRTPESIQTLIDISKSRLGPFVKQLGVSTEVLRCTKSSRGSLPSRPSQETSLTADQDAFISTGCDREMLTEALLNLQSVHLIQIRNVYGSTSYSMSTAPRDPSAKQRSLGLRKILLEQERMIEQAANRKLPTVLGDKYSARACLYSILLALGKADARPKELEVTGNTGNVGFDCKAFHIPACISSSVIPVLEQLKNLVLSLSPGTSVRPVRGLGLPGAWPPKISTYDVRTFLQYTTQLQILDINFNCLENRYDGFIEWLASVPSQATQGALPKPAPAIAFNCLQALSFHYIYGVHVQALLSVVRRFAPTLQNLYFHRVHLETHLQGDQASAPRAPGSVWIEFLRSLKIDLSDKLRYLHLTKVMETEYIGLKHHTPRVPRNVTFAEGEKRYGSCSYSGPAMEQALEAMIHYIEGDSFWRPPPLEGNWTFNLRKHEPENDFSTADVPDS